eukprot:jgi/Tetstr1/423991/TSEL_014602.t1
MVCLLLLLLLPLGGAAPQGGEQAQAGNGGREWAGATPFGMALMQGLEAVGAWLEGAQREVSLFTAAPSVGHFFALFGYLSAPLLALLAPLYLAAAIHHCLFGGSRCAAAREDSDGEEAPLLVPLREGEAAEVAPGS